jgi:hypothetical protein
VTEEGVSQEGYTLRGEPMEVDDPLCVAKRTADGFSGVARYWVKRATAGPCAGALFNPHSPDYVPESLHRKWAHSGRDNWEWSKVSADAFEAYLRFLRTGNGVHYRHAERL